MDQCPNDDDGYDVLSYYMVSINMVGYYTIDVFVVEQCDYIIDY